MLKQVYIFIWLACTQVVCAQQNNWLNHHHFPTALSQQPSMPGTEAQGVNSTAWRLHHYIAYNGVNSQWVLSDSGNYIYPDAFTGSENGWPNSEYYSSIWNGPQQIYVNNRHAIHLFNAQGKQTEETTLNWTGAQWLNEAKAEFTYDMAGNNTQYSYFTWFANNWYEIGRYVYTYNLQGYITGTVAMDTSGGGGVLTNQRNVIITRDGSNRQTYDTEQIWSNSAWVNYRRNYSFYTGSSTNRDSVYYYNWVNNAWAAANQKEVYTYGLGGFLMQGISRYLNNNVWVNSSRSDYTYDINGNQTSLSRYYWNSINNVWVYSDKYLTTYSATNKETETIRLDYNSQTQQLVNYYRYTTSYNTDDLPEQYINYSWANSAWDIDYRADYFYEEKLASSIAQVSAEKEAKAFPNPFKVNTLIQFNSPESCKTEITITDLTGKKVFDNTMYAQSGSNSFLWQAQDVNGNPISAGMYVLTIRGNNISLSSKIIKQ